MNVSIFMVTNISVSIPQRRDIGCNAFYDILKCSCEWLLFVFQVRAIRNEQSVELVSMVTLATKIMADFSKKILSTLI